MYLPVIADNDGRDIGDVQADFVRWQSRWPDVPASERPTDCLLALPACDKMFYPFVASYFFKSVSFHCYARTNVFSNENS